MRESKTRRAEIIGEIWADLMGLKNAPVSGGHTMLFTSPESAVALVLESREGPSESRGGPAIIAAASGVRRACLPNLFGSLSGSVPGLVRRLSPPTARCERPFHDRVPAPEPAEHSSNRLASNRF